MQRSDIVKGDDGQRSGHGDSALPRRFQHAQGGGVAGGKDRCRRVPPVQELQGRPPSFLRGVIPATLENDFGASFCNRLREPGMTLDGAQKPARAAEER